jgi:hypothetical protein
MPLPERGALPLSPRFEGVDPPASRHIEEAEHQGLG